MVATINKPEQAKKDYTLSLSEEEIEKQLSLIFEPQICPECGQDHSFKNSFEGVKTSIDDFPVYLGNKISIAIPIVEGGNLANTRKKGVIKK
jgi:hypothetical protein